MQDQQKVLPMLATIILYPTVAFAFGCRAYTVINHSKASQLKPCNVDGVLQKSSILPPHATHAWRVACALLLIVILFVHL